MKRIISLLLTLLILITSVPTAAFSVLASDSLQYDSDGDGESFAIGVTNTTIQPGDTTATVDINFVENTGVLALKFFLVYDKALSIAANSSVVKGDIFEDFNPNTDVGLKNATHEQMLADVDYADSLANAGLEGNDDIRVTTVYSECADVDAWCSDIGKLCSVTFQIDPEFAKDEYTVYAVPAIEGWCLRIEEDHPNADASGCVEIYDPACIPGTITVEGAGGDNSGDEPEEPVYTDPTIVVSDAEIEKGTETADFTISIENNPGIWGLIGYISYDKMMSLADFSNGTVMGFPIGNPMEERSFKDIEIETEPDIINVYEANGVSYDDVFATMLYCEADDYIAGSTANGTLASFSLNTAELEAGTYEIAFYVNEEYTINTNFENVAFDVVYGTLTVVGTVCDHEWDDGVITAEPTCTEDGEILYTCTICGEAYTEVIEATGHDFPEINGTDHVFCQVCEAEKLPDEEGMCGDYVYYELYYDIGVLVIYGEGSTNNYYSSASAPWYRSRSHIKTIIIESGVTTIGMYLFEYCTALTSIIIPDSVTSIGEGAFYDCDLLSNVNYTGDELEWSNISIESYNSWLTSANIQYNYSDCEHEWTLSDTILPTCVIEGATVYICSVCGDEKAELISALGHDYGESSVTKEVTCTEDGIITRTCQRENCDGIIIDESDSLPSCTEASYVNSMNKTFTYSYPGADSLTISFSSDSYLESGYDKIYIYEGNTATGDYYGPYTGSLSDVSVTVNSDSFTIKMTTDGSVVYYGFEVASVEIKMTGKAKAVEIIDALGHTYPENAGTASVICEVCGEEVWGKFANESGQCGDNVFYQLYYDTGALVIYGEGSMYGYSSSSQPWTKSYVKSVIICEGVTCIGQYAFYNTPLTSVSIASTVTDIYTYAFYSTALTQIEIPSNVKTIYHHAFANCTNLSEVTLNEGLQVIGYSAFANTAIEEITIPKSVWLLAFDYYSNDDQTSACFATGTDASAFYNSKLKKVIYSEGETIIDLYSFKNCKYLEEVVIPDTVTTIQGNAFYGTALTSIEIPSSVKTIYSDAFAKCTNLQAIEIPSSVKTIYPNAFANCTSLSEVTLNEGLAVIGYSAFANTAIEEITIPKSVWMLNFSSYSNDEQTKANGSIYNDASAFYNSKLKKATFAEGSTQVHKYAFYNCPEFAEVILPETVTSIGSYAFAGTAISDINFLASISEINSNAFYNCKNLQTLEIPSNVKTIYHDAFANCTSLSEVTLNEGLAVIGYSAFANTAIEEITIPKSVWMLNFSSYSNDEQTKANGNTNNYASAFYNSKLKKVVYSEGETRIDLYSFKNCTYLEEVVIPDTVTTIQNNAFEGCTALTSIEIPSNVKTIYHDAFANCTNLSEVTLNEGLQVIGYCAFEDTAIEEITIPKSVWMLNFSSYSNDEQTKANGNTNNYASAFYDSKLKKVIFEEGTTLIGSYSFQNCPELEEVIIPDTVKTIYPRAFSGCTKLSQVTLNEGLQVIGFSAFANTAIEEITIPKSVWMLNFSSYSNAEQTEANGSTNNYASAFYDSKLKKVIFEEGTTLIGSHSFKNCPELVEVTIPYSVKSIGNYAFDNCTALSSVFYAGAEDQWQKVSVGTNNAPLKNATVYYGHTHSFGEWEIDYEPTCTEKGRKYKSCSGCDSVTYEDIEMLSHSYKSVVTPPTCAVKGYTTYTCTVCGDQYISDIVDALGHSYIEKIIEPTCTEKGYTLYTCEVCSDHYSDNFVDMTEHEYGEWSVITDPTCTALGEKVKSCINCGSEVYEDIEMTEHSYETEIVPPTFLNKGYTVFTCTACGESHEGEYVDPLERTDLYDTRVYLEYTSVYYEGVPLTPKAFVTYDGVTYDSSEELSVTYIDNNKVGTATAIVEGINRFKGTAHVVFTISYEHIPEQIVNVIAIGEIGKISLSWGKSNEVTTDSYNIYRMAEGESEYQLIKTVSGRDVLSYEDKNVEKEKSYSYYVTGVGLYGAESEPSEEAFATAQRDRQAPTVLKVTPSDKSVVNASVKLYTTATDNVAVTKVSYYYSTDEGASWTLIGETSNKNLSLSFDTTVLDADTVKIKSVAYDAENNESAPLTVEYTIDNKGPEKVEGLSAETLSSKTTLSWNDVTANDAAYFILETKSEGEWKTVANKITTLGYTVTGLKADTDYIYRVACVDLRGNIGEYSDEFTARTAIDETAPVITSQGPNSARYNSTIKFTATAKDDCDIASIDIQVSTDRKVWKDVSTKTYEARSYKQTYSYTVDLDGYAEGSIYVRAVATDFTGNMSDTGDTAPYIEYIVDRTAPSAPQNISANGNDGYITVSWSMGDELDLGGYNVYKSTSLEGNYQLIASNLSSLNYHDRNVHADKEYYYKVSVCDTCGNMSSPSIIVSSTMAEDAQKPAITGISKTYDQKISESSHTINVSASDNNKLSYITVEYSYIEDGEYVQLVRKDSIDSHYDNISIELPIEDMEDGDVIYIRAYTADMAGLVSDTETAQYTFDGTAPGISNYELTSENDRVTLTWSDGGEKDLAGFKVYRHEEGGAPSLIGSRGAAVQGEYTFVDTIKTTESKTYYYTVTAIDKLGNEYSETKSCEYTYVYVNTAPEAVMDMPAYMTVGVEDIFYAVDSYDNNTIVEYIWDFGDGTTSNEIMPIKKYDEIGTYTVTLTVIDNEGLRSSVSRALEVKEREELGTITVKVVDDSGKKLSYVPVYFDLGSDSQRIVYTDASGCATAVLTVGTHVIGTYSNGYLPVKKEVVVLSNATRSVTLTTVEQELVTGEFEITRMTFDEIVAAGIDVHDPANQQIYSATVRVTYGKSAPIRINYVRNNNSILSYTVTDSYGKCVDVYVNDAGEARRITDVIYIPTKNDADIVAIVDIPAKASYLKEFFDVKLHIINNASSEFVLENNEVILNVPDGMTLMNSVTGSYLTSNKAYIDSIRGQETVTLSWVLRGDTAGEYDLSADFTGTLAEFNELVTARFETKEPIKVYGLEGIKFRILAADEIHNDALYYKVELENQRPIDIYMPSIGTTDKIKNVTESILNDDPENDFEVESYVLNAYVENENGAKQYIPISFDANGNAVTDLEVLAPGQKLVYEYVAYNATNITGSGYFMNAVITEFEGLFENIEVGSYAEDFYSFVDYSEKLDDILSGESEDIAAALEYIKNSDNYYYVSEAVNPEIFRDLYVLADVILNGDIGHFTNEEERELIEKVILSILSESSVVESAENLVDAKYYEAVKEMIDQMKMGVFNVLGDEDYQAIKAFDEILDDSKDLAVTYRKEGFTAFENQLRQKILGYSLGLTVDSLVFISTNSIDEAKAVSGALGKCQMVASRLMNAMAETEREAYYYSVLKYDCNAEVAGRILDMIIENAYASGDTGVGELIVSVASDLKEQLNSNLSDYNMKMDLAAKNVLEEIGEEAAKTLIKEGMKIAIGSTPLTVLSSGFNIMDHLLGWGDYLKQQDFMNVYHTVGEAILASFNNSITVRSEDDDFYSMLMLRALCEIRFAGEDQYSLFIKDYIDGVYGGPLGDKSVAEKINAVKNTDYETYEDWEDDIQYKMVRARDILFNIENTSFVIPDAPTVTLDYENMQTVQSFSEEYEYCFADGVWIAAEGKPISFECTTVPGTLRVRVAASDENLAGKITTVKLYAKKDLSKLIGVKYDGENYIVSGLTSTREYQLFFTNSEDAEPVWEAAVTVQGDDAAVEVLGIDEYDFVIVRSLHNPELEETYSNPLVRTVVKKLVMKLTVKGQGTVVQTDASGMYFPGDTVYLTAVANEGYEFIAWYVNGEKVSASVEYMVEMEEGLSVSAEFTKDPEAGDANADGVLNAKDVLLFKRYICGSVSQNDLAYQYADMNGDGVVNMRDSLLLKLKLVRGE